MTTISRTEIYEPSPEMVFKRMDDLGVTGMHMTKSSMMMMGNKLHLEFLIPHHTGLGSRYRWTGTMMGLRMDFAEEVTRWIEGREKVWETIGDPSLQKQRHGDRNVDISVPQVDRYRNHTPVLIDDIISTARTMIKTAEHLKVAGLKPPVCIGVHAVFSDQSFSDLVNAGPSKIITCNTIPHPSNAIDLSPLIIETLRNL